MCLNSLDCALSLLGMTLCVVLEVQIFCYVYTSVHKCKQHAWITYRDEGPSIFLCQIFHITYILHGACNYQPFLWRWVGDVLDSNSQPFWHDVLHRCGLYRFRAFSGLFQVINMHACTRCIREVMRIMEFLSMHAWHENEKLTLSLPKLY